MQGISGAPKGIVPQGSVASGEAIGTSGAGGMLNVEKDQKEASTEAKFSDVWKNIQSRYGAKPEKAREIKKNLGKDDFLRIMMTQMKNQDPTNPFKADQFATQMAQFTSVEQLQNLNQQMGKMATSNQPLERLAMTNMIGKTVTIDRERFMHTENQASTMAYDLIRDAKEVKVTVKNAETGEEVMTKDLGPMKQGAQEFAWDGANNAGGATKTGNFLFKVEAKDSGGRPIAMETRGSAPVVGVSFEGNEAILLVGDNKTPQKVALRNVIRVDSAPESLIPGARSLAAASAGPGSAQSAVAAPKAPAAPAVGGNFFAFEKGKGSQAIDPGGMTPEQMKALQSYEATRAAAMAAPAANEAPAESENISGGAPAGEVGAPSADNGFPSGFTPDNG